MTELNIEKIKKIFARNNYQVIENYLEEFQEFSKEVENIIIDIILDIAQNNQLSSKDKTNIIELFVKKQFKLDLGNDNGNIIHNLVNAHVFNDEDEAYRLDLRNIIEVLVKHNEELLPQKNEQGLNPLALAVEMLDVKMVGKLIFLKADVNSELHSANSVNILEYALYQLPKEEARKIAKILLEHEAKLQNTYRLDLWEKIYSDLEIKQKIGDRFKFTQAELLYLLKNAFEKNDPEVLPNLKFYTSNTLESLLVKTKEQGKIKIYDKVSQFINENKKEAKKFTSSFIDSKIVNERIKNGWVHNKTSKTWLNSADKQNDSPIYWAILNKDVLGVKALLENGANPNLNSGAYTNLYEAIGVNNYEIVQLLLEYGTDPNELYSSDPLDRPLDYAVEIGNPKIIRELMKYGAQKGRYNISYLENILFPKTDRQFFKSFFVKLKEEKYQIMYELKDYRWNYKKIRSGFDKLILKRVAQTLEEMITEGENARNAITDNKLAVRGKELVNIYLYTNLFKDKVEKIKNEQIELNFKEKCFAKYYGKFSMQLYKAAKEIMAELKNDDTYQLSYNKQLGEKIAAYNKISTFAWVLSFVLKVKEYDKYNKRQVRNSKLREVEREIAYKTESVIEQDLASIYDGQDANKVIAQNELNVKNVKYQYIDNHIGILTSFIEKIRANKIRPGIIAATEVLIYGNLKEVKIRYAAKEASEQLAQSSTYKGWVRKVKVAVNNEVEQAQGRK